MKTFTVIASILFVAVGVLVSGCEPSASIVGLSCTFKFSGKADIEGVVYRSPSYLTQEAYIGIVATGKRIELLDKYQLTARLLGNEFFSLVYVGKWETAIFKDANGHPYVEVKCDAKKGEGDVHVIYHLDGADQLQVTGIGATLLK